MKIISFLSFSLLYLSNFVSAKYAQDFSNRITPQYGKFSQNTVLSQLFEMLRSDLKLGKVEQGLPPLDPYYTERFELRLDNKILNFDANITEARFTGLSEFLILKSNFNKSEISIDLGILFPTLKLYSERYDWDGTLYDFLPVRGRGPLMLTVNNLKIWGKAWLQQSTNDYSILVQQFECQLFSVDSTESQIQFDENIDEILNQTIEDMLTEYLNRFNKAITSIYGDRILISVNKFLDNFDSWRFLSLILN